VDWFGNTYIWDEKVKIQSFLSGVSQSYKERIYFVEPKTLDGVIQKAMHCNEQNKSRYEENHSGKGNSKGKFDQRK